jgi:polysaccharide deacetylase family protein (PEP-CTERM system associated)
VSTTHVFTVDVEDYFHVNAFERIIDRSDWDRFPTRVERNTDIILELLDRHGAKGTFFTLGWVADKHPGVVRRIADAGHEIASHGWWHRKVTSVSREEFREDVYSSRMILEQISGYSVVGYRAPSFSITPGFEWAFDVLLETGYRYDSSLFPIKRMNYGYPKTPPIPHVIHRESGDLIEFPLATTRLGRLQIPAAGGGYLRQFPYGVIRHAFREHTAAGSPAVFYIHPWEVDPEQPRMDVPLLTRIRHYRNLNRTAALIERLLSEFKFTSVAQSLANQGKAIHDAGAAVRAMVARPRPAAAIKA